MALNEDLAIQCIHFPEGQWKEKNWLLRLDFFLTLPQISISLLAFSPHVCIKALISSCGSGLATGTAGS